MVTWVISTMEEMFVKCGLDMNSRNDPRTSGSISLEVT